MCSHCFVLTVEQYPQLDSAFGVAEVLCDSRLEYAIRLLLKGAECWEVRERQISLVKVGKVETFMAKKRFIGDNFYRQG